MKKKIRALSFAVLIIIGLCGCAGSNLLNQYDVNGIAYMAYTDIDSVCDNPELAEEGRKLLSSVEDELLLSFVVDSSIEIKEELGAYDHLIITNLPWIERFGDPDKLSPVEYDRISEDMREFLDEQMAILMDDGSVWSASDKIHLYEYEDGKLFAFPVNVTLGADKHLEAKHPLIMVVDEPVETLKASSCLLPLTSSGNVLFEDANQIQTALEESVLKDFCTIRTLE